MSNVVKIKNIAIGGGNKIAVQSMTNTSTADVDATKAQLGALQDAGCDIARIAVSNAEEVKACKNYCGAFFMPLVADIQFDYKLAIACCEVGFDKIRFNPGNIGSDENVKKVVDACKAHNVPIRIGVNTGSLEKEFIHLSKEQALVSSALKHVRLLEKFGFYDIVISVKSSSPKITVEAYRLLSKSVQYPLHIGVTESGSDLRGTVRSAIGVGSLLLDGIGDTIRISLSGDPVKEVEAARLILQESGVEDDYCEVISCPTCSRCKYDLKKVVDEIKLKTVSVKTPIKVAVMGCVVNGPGEAKDADFGVCGGGDGKAALFVKGKIVKTIEFCDVVSELLKLIDEKVKGKLSE